MLLEDMVDSLVVQGQGMVVALDSNTDKFFGLLG